MSCTIRASVTTGLEFLASEEVKEKLGVKDVEEGRGYVLWQNDIATVKQVIFFHYTINSNTVKCANIRDIVTELIYHN